jgi:DNA-directed RNA polymerase beta subunit
MFGSKGLVSEIIPEDEMPRTEDGKLIDFILNADSTVNFIQPWINLVN